MENRGPEARRFLSTPEDEARFWGLVGVAVFLGIGMVIFLSQPTGDSQMALNAPLGTERIAPPTSK